MDTRVMAQTMVLQEMIANHGKVAVNTLSGVGSHTSGYAEMGILYLVLMPYQVTYGVLGILGTLAAINILFVIITGMTVFLLTRKLTRSESAGLFAVLLFGLSQIGMYSEALNNWAGGFNYIPTLLLLSLLLFLYAFMEKRKEISIALLLSSFLIVFFAYILWDGGGYAIVAYLFVIVSILVYHHTKSLRLTLGLGIIGVIMVWTFIMTTGSSTSFPPPFQISTAQITPGDIPTHIIYSLGQFNAQDYQSNALYSSFMAGVFPQGIPFISWAVTGFLSTTFLAMIYLYKSRKKKEHRNLVYVCLLGLLIFSIPFSLDGWFQFVYLPIIILAGSIFSVVKISFRKACLIAYILLIAFAFAFLQIGTTVIYGGVSPPLKSASLWLSNNTATNATILTFQGDGTGVEFWAHRQSFLDTNIAGNQTQIFAFSSFLNANAYNFSYLQEFKPDYLLLYDFQIYNATPTPFNQTNVYLFKGISPENIASEAYNLSLQKVYSQNTIVIYRLAYQAKS